jgi:ABC-type amino acid transport system permease subunit
MSLARHLADAAVGEFDHVCLPTTQIISIVVPLASLAHNVAMESNCNNVYVPCFELPLEVHFLYWLGAVYAMREGMRSVSTRATASPW